MPLRAAAPPQGTQFRVGRGGRRGDELVREVHADFTWIEFYRPREMIDRGAEAAERALPDIRRALADRGLPQATMRELPLSDRVKTVATETISVVASPSS